MNPSAGFMLPNAGKSFLPPFYIFLFIVKDYIVVATYYIDTCMRDRKRKSQCVGGGGLVKTWGSIEEKEVVWTGGLVEETREIEGLEGSANIRFRPLHNCVLDLSADTARFDPSASNRCACSQISCRRPHGIGPSPI